MLKTITVGDSELSLQSIEQKMSDKRLVLVLNKADLVPRENLQAWVRHLRHEFPTIAFKASTQNSGRLGQAKIDLKAVDGEITTNK